MEGDDDAFETLCYCDNLSGRICHRHCASVQLPWSCKVLAVTTAVLAKQLEEEITAGGGEYSAEAVCFISCCTFCGQ